MEFGPVAEVRATPGMGAVQHRRLAVERSLPRAATGPLISAPGTVNGIIGDPHQAKSPTYGRYINTLLRKYQRRTGGLDVRPLQLATQLSPVPAYQQRLAYTSQTNSTSLNIRQRIHPLVDLSLFKDISHSRSDNLRAFAVSSSTFFNTPNFGGPGSGAWVTHIFWSCNPDAQANDARIGQLTAEELNF